VLRFFFKVTLDHPDITRHLVFVYEPRKLPRVLSPEEVLRLLEQADRDASRHQDRYVVNSRSILRRRIIEQSRRFRTGHGQARPSLYPAEPTTFKSASSSRCRASQATSPTPRRLTITPPATSAAPTSASTAPKSP
jgi:hypothetical protein